MRSRVSECVCSYESGKLDGQLRVVCVFRCVSARIVGMVVGGFVIFPLHKAWISGWAENPIFCTSYCEERKSKMKASIVVFPCRLYHSATRLLMQITDEELNHVCDWVCFLL